MGAELNLKGATLIVCGFQLLAARLPELALKLERLTSPTGSIPSKKMITGRVSVETKLLRFTSLR